MTPELERRSQRQPPRETVNDTLTLEQPATSPLIGSPPSNQLILGDNCEELGVLLGEAGTNTTRAMLEQLPDYWRHRCFHAEIEWVCNCVSAMLMNEGLPTIITPTCRGVMRANDVLRGAS